MKTLAADVTINGAELLGEVNDIGTIEPGKFADIVAIDGDPPTNIAAMKKVVFVMKAGAVNKTAGK